MPLNRTLPGETSTRIVGNYLRGRLPAIVDSYTNIVDVEDVADGHLLAAERGQPGERYILGGENLRWSEVIERVARISGRAPAADRAAARGRRWRDALARRVPIRDAVEGIRLMAPDWRYSSAKAQARARLPTRAGATRRSQRTVDWYHGADRERPPGAAHRRQVVRPR